MRLVIDANVLFAAFISKGKTVELLLLKNLQLYAPELILEELYNYYEMILAKTKRNREELEDIFNIIRENIIVIPKELTWPYLAKATEICPDPKDIDYFAVALYLGCGLWSQDKKLSNQNIIKVYSTEMLVDIFDMKTFIY